MHPRGDIDQNIQKYGSTRAGLSIPMSHRYRGLHTCIAYWIIGQEHHQRLNILFQGHLQSINLWVKKLLVTASEFFAGNQNSQEMLSCRLQF
jgi:hypothetical protein